MTLTDLLSRLQAVTQEGDGFLALCPGHADSDPSLRISVSKTGKVLLKCRAGCKTVDVLSAIGLDMTDLATMEVGDVSVPTVASAPLPATPTALASLQMRLDSYHRTMIEVIDGDADVPEDAVAALKYARDRFGLRIEDVIRLELGYSGDGEPRLIVPFRTPDGIARNYQGRALRPEAAVRWQGPHSPAGGSWSPLGFFYGSAGTWSEVVICEGPGDALTAAAAGFDTIAIAGASRVNNPAVVSEVASWVGDRVAVIAGDGDQAGSRFSATLARGLTDLGVKCYILTMPDGQDLNDWRLSDPDGFPTALADRVNALVGQAPVSATEAALAQWDEDRYSLNDLGGALYLRDYVESIGSGVRYNPETGFYLLDGGVWRRDHLDRIRTHAHEVAELLRSLARAAAYDAAVTESPASKKRAARLNRYSDYLHTSKGIDGLLRELRATPGVPIRIEQFDRDHHLLAFKNGVVDLRTGELRPHDASLLMTRRIEYDYIPDARAPRWHQYLREVFPRHPELPDYLQRVIGYGITGSTDEQMFVVHYGKGSNGKSVLIEVLTRIFADITVTTPFTTFEQKPSGGIPNDLAALNGARLVFATEGDAGRPMAEALLKRVTGRDAITARYLNREFFTFYPTFLIQLATNAKPAFRGQDDGLWRRVKLVPWERQFSPDERDPHLPAKIIANEAEGVIAWAVAGAVEWHRRGGLDDPDVIKNATREYKENSNNLDGFLPGVYVPGDGTVLGQDLFEDYLQWADEEHLSARDIWKRTTFFSVVEERGFPKRRSAKGMRFDGLVKAAPDDTEEQRATSPLTAHSSVSQPSTSKLTGPSLSSL